MTSRTSPTPPTTRKKTLKPLTTSTVDPQSSGPRLPRRFRDQVDLLQGPSESSASRSCVELMGRRRWTIRHSGEGGTGGAEWKMLEVLFYRGEGSKMKVLGKIR